MIRATKPVPDSLIESRSRLSFCYKTGSILQQAASADRISLLTPQDYDMPLAFQTRNLNLIHRRC